MSKLVLFKDLRKRSSDLLTKEFPGDKSEKKLEWKGDTSTGGFEALFAQDDKGAITGTVKPKVVIKNYNAEVNGEFTTKQDFKLEVSGNDHLAAGLKTLGSLNQKKGEVFGAVGVEYKHENATVAATVDLGKKDGPSVIASSVFGQRGFSLGFSTTYLAAKGKLEGLELTGSYRSSEFDASIFGRVKPDEKTKKDTQEVGFSYYHDINSDLAFASEGTYNLASKNIDLMAGLQYKIGADATVKGKFSNSGNLGVSLQQKLNPRTRFTLSSNVDLQALQQAKAGTTFGFGLNFNA